MFQDRIQLFQLIAYLYSFFFFLITEKLGDSITSLRYYLILAWEVWQRWTLFKIPVINIYI